MAILPQDTDYGGRPSLSVRRLDRPGTGGIVLADALQVAASTFDSVIKERQSKEDALNYALARNEIQQADLESRTELEGDQNWEGYDNKYSNSFNKKRDDILTRYKLSQNDMAIISSESDLIVARGRVAVGEVSRTIEIDQGIGKYRSGKERARQSLIGAVDGASRNAIVLGQLDAINAAETKGYLDAEAAQIEREKMTQDFALGSIEAMSKPDQIAILSASLANRRGDGKGKLNSGKGPLTADDIREGKGTGSIADFLHADTAAKMLEAAQTSDKENERRTEAQGVLDTARDLFPESHEARMKYIKDNSTGTIRELAETNAEQLNNSEKSIKADRQAEIVSESAKAIEESTPDEPFGISSIPVDDWAELTYGQQKVLKNLHEQVQREEYHARETVLIAPDGGGMSMETWNALPDYGPDYVMTKTGVDLADPEWRTILSESDYRTMTSIQDALRVTEKTPISSSGLTVTQLVSDVLNATNYMGSGPSDKSKKGIHARLRLQLEEKITTKQNSFTPPRALIPEEKRQLLNQMMQETAYIDDWGYDDEYNVATMTPSQLNEAYLPLAQARSQLLPESIDAELGGAGLTVYQYLSQRQRELTNGVDDDDMARAYFAYQMGMSTDEIESRLEGN